MIKELIVVEGKSDTQKLKKIFGNDIKTLETKGLAINEEIILKIKQANKSVGVIIFTDPDGPGKRIRETIVKKVNEEIKNAYITKQDIISNKKIGIAEASDESIVMALEKLISFNPTKENIEWNWFLKYDLFKKENKEKIIKHFGWDTKTNTKTIFKWLNWTNVSKEKILEIVGK